jgi:hypothetical protein
LRVIDAQQLMLDARQISRGFGGLAQISWPDGYIAASIGDRVDVIEDIVAKDDRVWAVWTLCGTHTGPLFGIPATGKRLEILEAGIWRIEGDLVAEVWFSRRIGAAAPARVAARRWADRDAEMTGPRRSFG